MTGQAKAHPAPFDQLADRYDELWTHTPAGTEQRALVWRHVDRLFHRGEHILDIGCGTGVDAAHLLSHGVHVHATDSSPAMVRAARRRGGFPVSELRAEEIATLGKIFDGAISNFGALNCVEDLCSVARQLALVIRPGGSVAICTIGRFCAWETLHYACRLQFRKAFRRFRGTAASSLGITVHYPTVAQFTAAFSPHFELRRWTGIGVLVPPSYVTLPDALVRFLGVVDRALSRIPLLRALADHRLLMLVRK